MRKRNGNATIDLRNIGIFIDAIVNGIGNVMKLKDITNIG
jgi:hypothetical protein